MIPPSEKAFRRAAGWAIAGVFAVMVVSCWVLLTQLATSAGSSETGSGPWVTGSAISTPFGSAGAVDAVADKPQIAAAQTGAVQTQEVPGQPLRIQLPRLGLDTRLLPSGLPSNGVFNPPTTYNGYWMADYGTAGPGAQNTTYLVGHSWNSGGAAFNGFLDIRHSTGAVLPGDKLRVTTPEGAWNYTVTGTAVYEQATIGGQAELWKNQPGRLVVITCFQYNDATVPMSGKNYVLYAEMDGGLVSPGGKR